MPLEPIARYKAQAGDWWGLFSNPATAAASARFVAWHHFPWGSQRLHALPWSVVDLRTGAVLEHAFPNGHPAVRAS